MTEDEKIWADEWLYSDKHADKTNKAFRGALNGSIRTAKNWRRVLNCFAKNPTEEIIKSVFRTRFHDPDVLNKDELFDALREALAEIRTGKQPERGAKTMKKILIVAISLIALSAPVSAQNMPCGLCGAAPPITPTPVYKPVFIFGQGYQIVCQ